MTFFPIFPQPSTKYIALITKSGIVGTTTVGPGQTRSKILNPLPQPYEIGNRWSDLSYVLGGWNDRRNQKGELLDSDKASWKPDISVLKAVAKFVKATGRLREPF
jgi:hypothetical protein